jgi:hypothetical protein
MPPPAPVMIAVLFSSDFIAAPSAVWSLSSFHVIPANPEKRVAERESRNTIRVWITAFAVMTSRRLTRLPDFSDTTFNLYGLIPQLLRHGSGVGWVEH